MLLIILVFGVVCIVLFVFVLFLVRPMLSMSLDCQFLITPPLFCNLYFQKVFLGRYQLLVEKNSVNCAQMTKDGIGN